MTNSRKSGLGGGSVGASFLQSPWPEVRAEGQKPCGLRGPDTVMLRQGLGMKGTWGKCGEEVTPWLPHHEELSAGPHQCRPVLSGECGTKGSGLGSSLWEGLRD